MALHRWSLSVFLGLMLQMYQQTGLTERLSLENGESIEIYHEKDITLDGRVIVSLKVVPVWKSQILLVRTSDLFSASQNQPK
jgi:hypothetical protein